MSQESRVEPVGRHRFARLADVLVLPQARRTRARLIVFIIAAVLEVGGMAVFGLAMSHHDAIGVTGAYAVLVAVAASVLAGPWLGLLVALVAGLAFFGFIADFGDTAPAVATIAASAFWVLAALVSGLVASGLRRQEAARRTAEREVAHLHARLESNLLPEAPKALETWDVVTRYVPSESRLELSGDFYDVVSLEHGGPAVLIGDVIGHGPDAAALGTVLRSSCYALLASGASPAQIVVTLEDVLERERGQEDRLATLCIARFGRQGDYVDLLLLGHASPLLIADGHARSLLSRPALSPVGTTRVNDFEVVASGAVHAPRVELPREWSLLFYTDGLVEGLAAPGSHERYGLDRLIESIEQQPGPRLDAPGLDSVLSAAVAANGGPLPDDVAVVQVSGSSAWLSAGPDGHPARQSVLTERS